MKVQGSAIRMDSQHSLAERHEISESLTVWADDAGAGDVRTGNNANRAVVLELSDKARQLQLKTAGTAAGTDAAGETAFELSDEDKIKLQLLEAFIEGLTGKKVKLRIMERLKLKLAGNANPGTAGQQGMQARQGWGLVYNYHEAHFVSEKLSFNAAGVVKTADGREINFAVNLQMSRQYYSETNINIRAGDALKDPLVINFDGAGASLTLQKYDFDLDADGSQDRISFVNPGSGFLALDRNGDGKVNDGSELFGPQSGNGFADLAKYDTDGNNWIDENDAVFGKLRVWTKDADGGDALFTLSQAGVGAIYLGNVSTDFALKDSGNALQGQIRRSGIFLRENGPAGIVQQVDLAV